MHFLRVNGTRTWYYSIWPYAPPVENLFLFDVVGILPEPVDPLGLLPDGLPDLLDLLSVVPLEKHPTPLGPILLSLGHVIFGL